MLLPSEVKFILKSSFDMATTPEMNSRKVARNATFMLELRGWQREW